MAHSSDEDSDLSDSEINDYKEKPYKELQAGKYKVKGPNGVLRCPFCAGKKKQDYKYKELLAHAAGVGKGSSNRSALQKANHLALAMYLESELAEEAEKPLVVEPDPEPMETEKEQLYCWPWTGIVKNIITNEPKSSDDPKSKKYWLNKYSKYKPLEVEIFWDDQSQIGQAIVEFEKDWSGHKNAMEFEKSFEAGDRGRNGWNQKQLPDTNLYGWFARADDYELEGPIGEYLRRERQLRTISDIVQEAAPGRNQVVANLTNQIDMKNEKLEMTGKCVAPNSQMAADDDNVFVVLNGSKLRIPHFFVKKFKKIWDMVEEGVGLDPVKPIVLEGPKMSLEDFDTINQYWVNLTSCRTEEDRELMAHLSFIRAEDRATLDLYAVATQLWDHPVATLLDKELQSRRPSKSNGPYIWLRNKGGEKFFLNQHMLCNFPRIMSEIEKGKGCKISKAINIGDAELSEDELLELFLVSRAYFLMKSEESRNVLVHHMYEKVDDEFLSRLMHGALLLGNTVGYGLKTEVNARSGLEREVKMKVTEDVKDESETVFNGKDMPKSVPQLTSEECRTIIDFLQKLEASRKEDMAAIKDMIAEEKKKGEAVLCKMVEKSAKANFDAIRARIEEESAKQEKAARERQQQITNSTNASYKELENLIKKELAAVEPAIARVVTPVFEKSVSTAFTDSFQRGVGDNVVNLLEKSVTSKIDASLFRHIEAQFQTSGKQAIQEALKTSLEATVVPAFDRSCQAMFKQVDATFQKGMVEHCTASKLQYDSAHSPLAAALRDVINSASSVTQTLKAEFVDGRRKLLALAVAGANSKAVNPLITQLSNKPLGALHDKIEAPLDPTKELSRLVSERKYEEAFTAALHRKDVAIVSWLCSQVDLPKILFGPAPLSQGVLLSLLQQLACDITTDTARKLGWMTDVAFVINPSDPLIAVHVRPIFEQVYQILDHRRSLPNASNAELSRVLVLMHKIKLMCGK